MKTISTQKEAKKIKAGEEYIIDVFPEDPDKWTDKHVEKAQKIKEVVNDAVL